MSSVLFKNVSDSIVSFQRRNGHSASASRSSSVKNCALIVSSSVRIYCSSNSFGMALTPNIGSMTSDWLKLIAKRRLAAANCDCLNYKKQESRCMNLQYCIDNDITYYAPCIIFALSIPKSL